MLLLFQRHRTFFLVFVAAGIAFRLLFLFYFPAITDDSRVYADFATNWLQHGTLGHTESGQIVPTDTRLPGYPAFLAAVFALFGVGNFRAVLLIQILVDLGTSLLIADLARRTVSERAAQIAFVLATLCPFLANYSAAVLAETLEVFFTALALDFIVTGLDLSESGVPALKVWIGAGLAVSAAILLRPDGGLLLIGIGFYFIFLIWKRLNDKRSIVPIVRAGAVVGFFALVPLVPWTIRNFRTLHHFQPLAPRYATQQDELAPLGFNCWARTWIADYASVEEIYWLVPGDKIDPDKLPARAFDTPQQREATLALIADYNQSQDLTRELDVRFGQLAAERIQSHRLRYYLTLPALRIIDMWMRPRTELLPPDVRWWEFDDDPKSSVMAVTVGVINLAYVGIALAGIIRRGSTIRNAGLLLSFVVVRSLFLGTLENPEPRYTLECYPVVIVLAAALISGSMRRTVRLDESTVQG